MPLIKYRLNHDVFDYTTEASTKVALTNLGIFLIFLIGVTVIGSSLTAERNFRFSSDMHKLMDRTLYRRNSSYLSFDRVITITDFWDYMEFVALKLFHGSYYDETSEWEPYLINVRQTLDGRVFLNESILLGPPRLRQIRVKENSCTLNYAFRRYFNSCMGEYSHSTELTDSFYKGTKYMSANELDSTSISGLLNTYYSGAYVQMLTYKDEVNRGIIRHLKNINWFNRGTRLIILEFNLLNLNLNLYHSVKLIFEVPPSGLINIKYSSKVMASYLLFSSVNWILSTCILVTYTLNIYFTYIEVKKILAMGFCNYLMKLNVLFTLPRIIIIYLSMIFTIYLQIRLVSLKNRINEEKSAYISLDRVVYMHGLNRILIGILLFLSWIGLLKYMDFNPVLRTIGHAMHMASTDLYAFTIMFLILFSAYGNLGLLLFGGLNENFRNVFISIFTMVRIVGGDFNYFKLEADFKVMGPIFFMTYVMLMFFVLKNMFLAVIVLSYRTATSSSRFKPNFLCYFLRKHLYRISNGLFKAPQYPAWTASNETPDAIKFHQLQMYMDYAELDNDIDVLLDRLSLIETIFFRLTNDLEDLTKYVLKKNKRRNRSTTFSSISKN